MITFSASQMIWLVLVIIYCGISPYYMVEAAAYSPADAWNLNFLNDLSQVDGKQVIYTTKLHNKPVIRTSDDLFQYISKYEEQPFPWDKYLDKLRNRYLIMIGDSLTRYQYISLVYSLKFREYMSAASRPNYVVEKTWPSWYNFYWQSTKKLGDDCDCHRKEKEWELHYRIIENRRYRDPRYNITIYYYQYFGRFVHGHYLFDVMDEFDERPAPPPNAYINATKREELNRKIRHVSRSTHGACYNPEYLFPQDELAPTFWLYTLPDFIEFLHPKHTKESAANPLQKTTILINTGHWASEIGKPEFMERVINGTKAAADQVIWKTTTNNRCLNVSQQVVDFHHDEVICPMNGIDCMNLSWTRLISNMSWDCFHFSQPLYHLINDQMIDLLN